MERLQMHGVMAEDIRQEGHGTHCQNVTCVNGGKNIHHPLIPMERPVIGHAHGFGLSDERLFGGIANVSGGG